MDRETTNPLDEGWQPHEDGTYVAGMGTVYERTRDGLIEIALQTDDRHKNLSGIVHGGVVMTLIDRTVGINCRASQGGVRMATASLTISFLRQIRVGDFIVVRCTLNKTGRRAIFADAEAEVAGKLVATATGICMTAA